jgi:syntaxin 18
MADLTPTLNELLKSHDARPTLDLSLTLRNIDEFLKEAYRIVSYMLLVCKFSTYAIYRTPI